MKKLAAVCVLSALFSIGFQMELFADAESKLDQVLAKQEAILAKLDELKSEIQIVKVRASQQS